MRKLTVCGQDISAFCLVLKSNPDPAERTAAHFLKRVIFKSCGVTVPISDHPGEHGILFGFRLPGDAVKWDGFRISSDADSVYLDGNLARGTLYAAYDFAERYLGYRYFTVHTERFSTEGASEVPAWLDLVENPGFEARRTTCFTQVHSAELSAHDRLNDCMPTGPAYGGGLGLTSACHSFHRYLPQEEFFTEHPEYFAERNGVRTGQDEDGNPTQPCLTNPDVLRIVTERILNELRARPNTPIVELSQGDNEEYCTCEKCSSVDREEGSPSGTMLRFVNAVAERVEEEFPNVLVRTFAYWYTRVPPKITRARKNVLVRYCTMHACCRHGIDDPNCERNYGTFYPEMLEWRKRCSQMSVWDYITEWRAYIPPFPNLLSLRENIRFFKECGAIHVLCECNSQDRAGGTTPEMKAYLAARLLWNPDMSMEEYQRHIREFLEAYYGPGWEYVWQYLQLEYETTENRHVGCMDLVDTGRFSYGHFYPAPYQEILPDNHLTELASRYGEAIDLISRAEEQAETEEQRYRLGGIRLSLDYMEICCSPHEKDKMTPEEQAIHEERVKELDRVKTARNCHYNLRTENHERR
ncbi:MAG: DUF4838 domain-containing protein [Clostridia bacterium]|nr:DUF4838 domain-containing protein [Clostridia bacterium]